MNFTTGSLSLESEDIAGVASSRGKEAKGSGCDDKGDRPPSPGRSLRVSGPLSTSRPPEAGRIPPP